MELKKAVSIVLTATLLLSMLLIAIPPASAQATTVEIVPSLTAINYDPLDPVGSTTFTVSCMVYDVVDLAGFDIQIAWDTAYLDYDSHTATLGCLNAPTFMTKNDVDAIAGTYWLAAASLNTVDPGFDGSGEAFEMTFQAINVPFGAPGTYIDTFINFTSTDLAESHACIIPHTTIDGTVRIYLREFVYPPWPMLKVDPASYEAGSLGENFDISCWLLGEGDTDLDPFWDVGGIDIYMNFNTTLMEALSVTIDPDYDFGVFWPGNLTVFVEEINNVDGYVHVAFAGVPGVTHISPFGQINMFTVTFNATYASTSFPPPSSLITLENPFVTMGQYFFDSIGGLIDLASPVGAQFTELIPHHGAGPHEMLVWTDKDADGELSIADQVMLNNTASGFYFDYYVTDLAGTLNVTLARTTDDHLWAASFGPDNLGYNGLPGRYLGTDDPYNGFGVPYWTGNFSLGYAIDSVNTITVHALPFTGDEYTYTLTEGVDFIVHAADDLIELLNPVDVPILNEYWVDGVNNSLNGWPYINYVASGIQSVYVKFPNGTERVSPNAGYAGPPPGEWWYDPDWAWELEGWWGLGYYPGPWTWPAGSEWWINYTAASYLTVDYNTDPTTAYVESDIEYHLFLAALACPGNNVWNEVYPNPLNSYNFTDWTDSDTSGTLTEGDFLGAAGLLYRVDGMGTDLTCGRKPWICVDDPLDPFFGVAPIVEVAGFPQPEADYCPWHNHNYSVPLPHVIADGEYTAPYKALGGFIDVFVCNYEEGFKGVGKDKPADMFWPQKAMCLCANVTYAGWPEQNKDVAFEIKLPNGTVYAVNYARTDENGTACIQVRLPWPCDDPEAIFGVWKVWATVDVACVVVNDTMEFKYDYRIRIFGVETNKDQYKHCENIIVTIEYGTQSMQEFTITFTLTVTDASGVPIGFAYMQVMVGGAEWCTYENGTLELSVHVVKWARPPIGTIYVGGLSDFPQNGGSAETPVYISYITILDEWA